MAESGRRIRPRIAVTLARYGLAVAVFLGLVTGIVHIVLDYRQQADRDEIFIQNILKISSSGAAEAAFQLDPALASHSLNSLRIYDFVSNARIIDEQGQMLAAFSVAVPPSPFDGLTRVFSEPFKSYSIDLKEQVSGMNVGRLTMQVHNTTLLGDFYSRSVRYMVTGLFRNLLLTAILLYLFSLFLTRPLEWLVARLNRVDPRLPEPFQLTKEIRAPDNEVTMVAEAANSILTASRDYLRELDEANREAAKLDEKLRQSERLAVVGQLVGGIAHDYNNILAVILGNLELLESDRLTDAERAALESAQKAVENGANLTSQLLIFSRKQPLAPSVVNADDLLPALQQFLRPILGEDHELKIFIGNDVWPCLTDRRQLEAALLNLAINASHATPEGGTIIIESFNVRLDEHYCAAEANVTPGDYVCFSVTDNGQGMSEEVLAHAFEPYFTTKPVGQGSGLGLSMVYGFAKQSGGHVKIYSQQDYGTIVKLYLPRLLQDDRMPSPGIARQSGSPQIPDLSGKRILVVEDNPDVLRALENHLQAMQTTVISFETGQDAVDYAQQNPPVDAALLDVILRGKMNGPAVRDALLQLWPGLRVVFMSGYTEHALEETGKDGDNIVLLHKPFDKQRLAEVLSQLFEQSHGNATQDRLV